MTFQPGGSDSRRKTAVLHANAVLGELVPQDPNDKPVAELLGRAFRTKGTDSPKTLPEGRTVAKSS